MHTTRSRHLTAILLAAALHAMQPPATAAAQNGTLERRTLTFSASATANLAFGIQPLVVDPAAPATTIIQLEFGKDGLGAVNDPTLGMGVNFTLTRTSAGGGTLTFPITALPSGNTSIGGKEITVIRNDPVSTPGLFTLTIVHTATTAAAETWTLGIAGLPTPSPAIRGIASVFGASTGFTSLTPVGACGAAAEPTVCPICPRCRYLPEWKYYYKFIPWKPPFPPEPDCPMCARLRAEKFDEVRFERALVVFAPTPEQRAAMPRGATKANPIAIQGGELVGPVSEGADGQMYQMIQYPKGKPPLISIGVPIPPAGADSAATPLRSGSSRNLLFGLGGLDVGGHGGLAVGRSGRGDGSRSV
jgi:hypothetical protein